MGDRRRVADGGQHVPDTKKPPEGGFLSLLAAHPLQTAEG